MNQSDSSSKLKPGATEDKFKFYGKAELIKNIFTC